MSETVDLKRIESIHQHYLGLDKRKTRDALVPSTEQRDLELAKFIDAYKRGNVYNPVLTYNTPLDAPEQLKRNVSRVCNNSSEKIKEDLA